MHLRRFLLSAIVLVGGSAFIAAGIYPPWTATLYRDERAIHYTVGHDWLTTVPRDWPAVSVDYGRLGLEWSLIAFGTAVAIGIVMLLLSNRSARLPEFRDVVQSRGR
jgi:hypothetical protein